MNNKHLRNGSNTKAHLLSGQRGVLERFLIAFADDPKLATVALKDFFEFACHLEDTKGTLKALSALKDINSACRKLAIGYPRVSNSFGGCWLRCQHKTGVPSRLKNLIRLIRRQPNIALAIPNVVYAVRTAPNLDVSTIEDPYLGTITNNELEKFRNFVEKRVPRLPLKAAKMQVRCKGGPNGPAAITQAQDLIAVNLMTWRYSFKTMINKIYGEGSWLETSFESLDVIRRCSELIWPKHEFVKAARLSFLSAPAGKTRVVFIANWWVQMLLLPFHEALLNKFRYMKGDCMWNQQLGVDQMRIWSTRGEKLFSFDLSAATDRWPIDHQRVVMDAAFGREMGEIWQDLIGLPTPYSRELKRFVNYEVGQPMGAYSSWAALNMTHHWTIRYLAYKNGVKPRYIVLGDDVVICGKVLADAYYSYMTKLGVGINLDKGVQCEDGKPSSAEFARHLVKDGNVVGTVSPNLNHLIINQGETHMIPELMGEVRDKFNLPTYVTDDAILLPNSLNRFLSQKAIEETLVTVAVPGRYDRNVVYVSADDELVSSLTGYNTYVNPWKGKDKSHVKNIMSQRWLIESKARLVELEKLYDGLAGPGSMVPQGYLLDCPGHPIKFMIENVSQELQRETMSVAFMRKSPESNLIETSIDLLIATLTKGQTYRQWRDSKSIKRARLAKFFKRTWKATPAEFIPAVSTVSWEDQWANLGK